MRNDADSVAKAVEQLSFHYSVNFCCILMLMLQWESENRPDFVTLETLVKNEILKMNDKGQAKKLFNALLDAQSGDHAQRLHNTVMVSIGHKRKQAKAESKSKTKGIYQLFYPDVSTFLASRKDIFEEEETDVRDSLSLEDKKTVLKMGIASNQKADTEEASTILMT